jgi:hypothetical protein
VGGVVADGNVEPDGGAGGVGAAVAGSTSPTAEGAAPGGVTTATAGVAGVVTTPAEGCEAAVASLVP